MLELLFLTRYCEEVGGSVVVKSMTLEVAKGMHSRSSACGLQGLLRELVIGHEITASSS